MDTGMFLPVQLAATQALKANDNWYAENNLAYSNRQKYACKILDILNCKYDKTSGGMFVWAEIPDNYLSGFELSDIILEKANVFITPGGIFGKNGKNYIRISLCANEKTLKTAIKRIESIVNTLKRQ